MTRKLLVMNEVIEVIRGFCKDFDSNNSFLMNYWLFRIVLLQPVLGKLLSKSN